MIHIYHNPKCSKSRDGICFLDNLNQDYEIIKYLDEKITIENLKDILNKLNYKPIELVRKKEKIWIEQFKDKNLTDIEIIEAMVNNPKLIERPIVINGNKAIVARPTDRIQEIL